MRSIQTPREARDRVSAGSDTNLDLFSRRQRLNPVIFAAVAHRSGEITHRFTDSWQ
jgi:hypothetical protein